MVYKSHIKANKQTIVYTIQTHCMRNMAPAQYTVKLSPTSRVTIVSTVIIYVTSKLNESQPNSVPDHRFCSFFFHFYFLNYLFTALRM